MEQLSRGTTKLTGIEISGFLTVLEYQEAECISWYHPTGYNTQTHRNYRSENGQSVPARNSII